MSMRRLNRSDLDDLLDLYGHLHPDDVSIASQSSVESIWDEILTADHFRYYGAFENRQLVSSCTLSVIPNLTRGGRPYGVVENVVTHIEHRRRGYGRRVLHAALADAWQANCYKVMLLTGRKDEPTLRFYESAGFDWNSKQAFVAKPPE